MKKTEMKKRIPQFESIMQTPQTSAQSQSLQKRNIFAYRNV